MPTPVIQGHVVVTTLAGNASLTVHQHAGPFCLPVLSMVLDPADVLRLADELTRASVPEPPVVRRRLQVRQNPRSRLWGIDCPECLPLPGLWIDQTSALAAANQHLADEHASERRAS